MTMKRLRRLIRNDDGVTEVIGYVLSFAISAIFLLLALNVFWAARANTDHVTTGVELKTIADRVAARMVELGQVSQQFPNSTLTANVLIPQSLNGRIYTIKAAPADVTVSTNDGELSAKASNFKVEALPGIDVDGEVDSSNAKLVVTYQLVGTTPTITITGE